MRMWDGGGTSSHTLEEPATSLEGKAYHATFTHDWFTDRFDYTPSTGGGIGGYQFLGDFTGTLEAAFTGHASFTITPLPEKKS